MIGVMVCSIYRVNSAVTSASVAAALVVLRNACHKAAASRLVWH